MLTIESSLGFNPARSYPTYEYRSKSHKIKAQFGGGRIKPIPKGFREVVRYATREDDFADYVKWLAEEHKDTSDAKLLETPWGPYIGRWRNARWQDEIKRRGLS